MTKQAFSSGKKSGPSPEKLSSEAPFIPFSQRQARSKVAAHEILKKGKQVRR